MVSVGPNKRDTFALLTGIGFTTSLLPGAPAFRTDTPHGAARAGVPAASTCAAPGGALRLRSASASRR
jgi:Na+/H+ antiporter NhaA